MYVFSIDITTKIRARFVIWFTCSVCVFVKQQKNIFDFIHNGHYAIAEEILHFYTCFQQIRLFFSLSLSHIDNKSPCSEIPNLYTLVRNIKYFFIFLFNHSRIHIIMLFAFSIFKIRFLK